LDVGEGPQVLARVRMFVKTQPISETNNRRAHSKKHERDRVCSTRVLQVEQYYHEWPAHTIGPVRAVWGRVLPATWEH
jgi:hypothetical protein